MTEEELEDLLSIGCCRYHEKIGKKAKKEIERLNNIINELEKWLVDEKEATIFDYHFAIEDVLDKLKELKGSDKE